MLPLLLLFASGLVQVPPAEWKAVAVPVGRAGEVLGCEWQARNPGRIQLLLLTRQDANLFQRGRNPQALHATGFGTDGRFRYRFDSPGDYVLIIDNRIGSTPASVQVRMDLSRPAAVPARELPPERRRIVVTLSLLFLGLVIVLSAQQFLRRL